MLSAIPLGMILSQRGRRVVRAVMVAGAALGLALGAETLVLHLSSDPLVDVRIYYDAGSRLNAGLPIYNVGSTVAPDLVGYYVYPPLLAIVFRPLAVLPYPVAALLWEFAIAAALVATILRIGLTQRTFVVLGWLALPICWAISIGQAEPLVALLLSLGSPLAVALAGHLKLAPWLAAAYWLGTGDRRALARFATAVIGLWVIQLVVAPDATVAYLRFDWMRPAFAVRNLSLYAILPPLWAIIAAVTAVAALRLARSRWGWGAAVLLTVVANPRLLAYQLMSLVAALGGPRDASGSRDMAGTSL